MSAKRPKPVSYTQLVSAPLVKRLKTPINYRQQTIDDVLSMYPVLTSSIKYRSDDKSFKPKELCSDKWYQELYWVGLSEDYDRMDRCMFFKHAAMIRKYVSESKIPLSIHELTKLDLFPSVPTKLGGEWIPVQAAALQYVQQNPQQVNTLAKQSQILEIAGCIYNQDLPFDYYESKLSKTPRDGDYQHIADQTIFLLMIEIQYSMQGNNEPITNVPLNSPLSNYH